MRKGTKKNIIHGILIVFVIIFALMASLVAAFRDVTAQSMMARLLAGELSERLHTDVKIRTFYITEKLEVCIEDMQINDLDGYPMFFVGRLDAKFSPTMRPDDIRVKRIYFKDVLGRLVKYEGDKKLNLNDMLSYLEVGNNKGKQNDKKAFHLKVDEMTLDNGHVIYWNQNTDHPEKLSMDYSHIDIDSIYGVFSNLEVRQDSVLGEVHSLKGIDKCGLVLDKASGNVLFCEKSLNIDNLILETNESKVDLDFRLEYNNSSAYYSFVDSVRIIGDIRPSVLKLSDIRYFSWVLDKMPDKFRFTAYYDGTVSDFTVKNFVADFADNSHIDADITFIGLPEFFDTYIDMNLRSLESSYEDTKNFAIPIESGTIPLPDMLGAIGRYTLKGSYQGYPRDFKTQFSALTEMGDINADIYLNITENSGYAFKIDVNNMILKDLLGVDEGASASFQIDMYGNGLEVKDTDFEADVHVSELKLYGNKFDNLNINGVFENQRFIAQTKIKHPYLQVNLSSIADLHGETPTYSINSKIRHIDLVKLHLLDNDSIMILSSNIHCDFSGNDIDNITGSLKIDKLKYFNGEEFVMNDFNASVQMNNGVKEINVECDFFDFNSAGIVNFKTLGNALANTAKRYVNMPGWFENTVPDNHKQDFWLSMNFKDTRTLTKLFAPSLYIGKGTTVNATYTDGIAYHGSAVESPEVWLNGLKFKNIDIKNTAKFDEFTSRVIIEDIILRDTTENNPDPISIENFMLLSRFGDDKVDINLKWDDDDEDDHNKLDIKSVFVPHAPSGGVLSLDTESIRINDTVWHLHPDCSIDFRKSGTEFSNLTLYTDRQQIAVHGMFPNDDSDTLYAQFHNVDFSDFDFITAANKIDFDGLLNGFVGFSGLNENFSFSSDINLDRCYLNGQEIGEVRATAKWHDPDESIFINIDVYNSLSGDDRHETAGLMGYYYPRKRKNDLRFDVMIDDFKLGTLSPFLTSAVSRVSGLASGKIKIAGSLSEPVCVGDVKFNNAGCQINYLNTYYSLSDKVSLRENKIVFDSIRLNDTIGNVAILNGVINHNYFKDFSFDLDMTCNDFFALNIPADRADGFYGTAVADGTVRLSGPANDVILDIDAVSKKGTLIEIPLSGTASVDNDFVVFVQTTEVSDTVVEAIVPEIEDDEREFTLNLNAAVNSDAVMNIYLPQNIGSINARGNGNVNIGVASGDFELRGDYIITSGAFNFSLEMMKRTFTLRNGGTLRWTGDPADADVDIVGVYRTKSSLTSLGTAAVDSTALTNNINVDCIIRLSDKLMNPTITFGLELPNVKEDTKTLVFSVIDTTNQGVMAQQVLSLMMFGSFAYNAESNISRIGTTAGYSVITSQLSNLLSMLSKDFDIGINYTPNDQLTNEEIEVSLSTQLFDDRLTIEGNFGVIRGSKSDASNANNIVGDVDLTWRLSKRWSFKAYNHTNIKNNYYYYSFENYSDFTQGIGISFSQSFDNLREVFTSNKKNKKKTRKNNEQPSK